MVILFSRNLKFFCRSPLAHSSFLARKARLTLGLQWPRLPTSILSKYINNQANLPLSYCMLSAKFLEVNVIPSFFAQCCRYLHWLSLFISFHFFFLFSSLFLLRHISHGNWVILLVKRILIVPYKRTCNNIVKRVFLFRIFMVNSQPRTGGLYKLFFLFTLLSGFRLSIMLFLKIINQYPIFFSEII